MSARRRKDGSTQATHRKRQPSPLAGLAQSVVEPRTGSPADLVRAHRRLEHLYEISKLLTRSESVERTVPAAIEIIAGAVPLRSAILMWGAEGGPALVWRSESSSDEDLRYAMERLHAAHAYLVGTRGVPSREVREAGKPAGVKQQSPGAADDDRRFIVLPLAVERRTAFGALQFEGAARLDEPDLVLINAAVNQLAIALDRQRAVELDQAAAESRKRDAEERQLVAERARTHAEELEAAANDARREAERMRDLASTVTESLAEGVIAVNVEGRITLLNPAAASMLGWSEEEAVGRRVEDVVQTCSSDGAVVTDEESPFRIVMRSRESLRNDDEWFIGRDRRPLAVGYTAAALSRNERMSGAVLAFRDVTDAKRAERDQRLLVELSARLASSVGGGAALEEIARFVAPLVADFCVVDELDPSGSVRACEVAFADENKHRALAEAAKRFAPEQSAHTPQAKALASGRACLVSDVPASGIDAISQDEAHAAFLRSAGLCSMIVMPLSAHGQTLGVMTCGLLDSERRYAASDCALFEEVGHRAALAIHNARLYEQAKNATRARDELLAMVSHDLRNPLSVILTAVSMMASPIGSDDVPVVSKQLARIKRAAETMDHLICDLLDTASIESGTLALDRERLVAAPVVREVIETMQARAARKALRLTSELSDELPPVIADAGRLEQVLANLVGNAIKFTPEGGAVTIRAERSVDVVRFSVTDTGPGIPGADIPHLFDRFWRAGATARLGTGLGLAIVKGIVEAHGGNVWVESTVGVGSSFVFTLPSASPATHAHGMPLH